MNPKYYQALTERILNVLNLKPLKLCDIIKESQGAYPVDVANSLDKLIKEEVVLVNEDVYKLYGTNYSKKNLKKIKQEILQPNLLWINQITTKLSKPHPADYDWRFTSQTIYDLAQLINDNQSRHAYVALFGTTTLFPIIKRISPDIKLSLFNKSQILIQDIENMGFTDGLYVQDLFLKIPSSTKYNLVIADPPWYNDFYNAFISRASDILKPGGHLYLSVLPVLTRPDAEKDRKFIDDCCRKNGFEKIDSKNGFLNYESPIFEKHSLTSSAIQCSDWRRGDLIIYQKIKDSSVSNITSSPADEPVWEEFVINHIKLKLLENDDNARKFSFEYADETNLLSTVSRRSQVRHRINFWTSENYAFKVSRLEVLRDLFRFVNAHNSLQSALKKVKIDKKLTEVESKSLIDLLKIANIYT